MTGNPRGNLGSAAEWLKRESKDPGFAAILSELLFDLCELRSIPGESVARTALEESAVFDRLIETIKSKALPGRISRLPIDDRISEDLRYTKPYYTSDATPYRNRANLIHVFEPEKDAPAGPSIALNAHIDTVAPYFKPYLKDGNLYGRGACDDKGCCVALIGASMLLEKLRRTSGIAPRGRIISMFVIDEESGGNGSLSLAADKGLAKLYDSIVIAESTEGQIHPANRGAIWYKVDLGEETPESTRLALKLVRAFENTGRALRKESEHPLFPSKPVQTCHGILGNYGEHPSRICGYIEFSIRGEKLDKAEISALAEKGLADYIAEYADRTKVIDPLTNKPKIEKHYDLIQKRDHLLLKVYGNTGHMGSSLENDNAITKAAFIVPGIQRSATNLRIGLARKGGVPFILEGGQGFLPSHSIGEVKARMKKALDVVYTEEHAEGAYRGGIPSLSFDKLHNDAFARDPDSAEARKAVEAARLVGIEVDLPLSGFSASCDARLFAQFHQDKQVLTAGPGSIRFAHADNEHIDLVELARSCAFYALYALSITGALEPD